MAGVESSTDFHDPEIVICAAILAKTGQIIRCHRHHDGLRACESRQLVPMGQGFITSRNRFVTRTDGLRLQVMAGIASKAPGGYRGEQLFSEDLY